MLIETTAVIGALAGVTSLAWQIRDWVHDRADLRLAVKIKSAVDPQSAAAFQRNRQTGWSGVPPPIPRPMLGFTLENRARRDVCVRGLGGKRFGGEEFSFGETAGLPRTLRSGESAEVVQPLDVFKEGAAVESLHAIDGDGRRWSLSPRSFREIQSEARGAVREELDRRDRLQELDARDIAEFAR